MRIINKNQLKPGDIIYIIRQYENPIIKLIRIKFYREGLIVERVTPEGVNLRSKCYSHKIHLLFEGSGSSQDDYYMIFSTKQEAVEKIMELIE